MNEKSPQKLAVHCEVAHRLNIGPIAAIRPTYGRYFVLLGVYFRRYGFRVKKTLIWNLPTLWFSREKGFDLEPSDAMVFA